MSSEIQVVKRDTIPPISTVEEGGEIHHLGELRDFRWSEPLRDFMGDVSGFSVSWVQLMHGEILQPHTHPVLSLMVFYAGEGQIIGDLVRPIGKDDVVVVPAGYLHGFVGGPPGLYALSIQFAQGLYTKPEEPRVVFSNKEHSLERLVALSDKRLAAFAQKPAFRSVADGTLSAPARAAFLDAMEIWLDGIQPLFEALRATCVDPKYAPLVAGRGEADAWSAHRRPTRAVRDARLRALSDWFSYQMYVLDNAEKVAVVHFVVDRVNELWRTYAMRLLGRPLESRSFGSAVGDDRARASLGKRLLGHETPAGYQRLSRIIAEAWDMADAVSERVDEITRSAVRRREALDRRNMQPTERP